MKERVVPVFVFFFLSFLISSNVLASEPEITGIIHYHDGFLVLTHHSNNTTQLWFFEPGKGFKLLNATFPNLTFIHSTGDSVLLYRNLSKGPYLQDFGLYIYDGKLHFLGNYSETDNWGVGSEIYWNGKFYLFLEADWSTQRGDYYDWYAIVGDKIYRVFPPSPDSSLYLLGVWELPSGYLIEGNDPMSYQSELFLIALNGSRLVFRNLTPANLSVGGLCFNGTHFAALDSNWFKVIFYNASVWKYYLQIISPNGNYWLIPIDSFAKEKGEHVYLDLLGYQGGEWVVRKYLYWCNRTGNYSRSCHERTLNYFLVSRKGVEKIGNSSNLTGTCRRNYPQIVFKGRQVVKSPLKLNGKDVTINGTLLSYDGKSLKIPFNVILADCSNGCLLSNGKELAYFDGYTLKPIKLPVNRVMIRWLSLLGVTFVLLFIGGIAKARRR
ncbi:hypothetical protein [Thermococcus thermotolerans]|uniref:hypothetical protein n=1 Tax=Thermococcus thermotolerans TaxID=2969672 RepID=UPI002157D0A2|nr:hypothetical protein [Thermococcus thermotolerans]